MQISSLFGHTQELLSIVTKSDRPADSLIDTFFRSRKYLGSHDRKFIAETLYGTLRHLRKCEFILDSNLPASFGKLNDEDRITLILTTFLCLEEKSKEIKAGVVSRKLVSKELIKIIPDLIPMLASSRILPLEPLARRIGIEYSYPEWMVQKLIDQCGADETVEICASLNNPAPLTLRVNILKTDVETCRKELSRHGIQTSRTKYSPFGLIVDKRVNLFSLKSFRDGWFEVQDEGSQLLPLIIDPKPNAKLLDLCAGAGGKTLEFAAIMKNRGEIFATDINEFRLKELHKRARRSGAQNIRVVKIESIDKLAEKFNGYFDIVFIDAPCSGIGTIRRNPGLKWMVTEKTIDELSEKQKSILNSASFMVKKEGMLSYATCTMLRKENEDVVEHFLANHPDFDSKESAAGKLGISKMEFEAGHKYFHLSPQTYGTDGFFCAVMERRAVR